MIDGLGIPPAVQGAVASTPIPGWQTVTAATLAAAPTLTGPEAVRFFDGAVPTLRHAISPLIPRLDHADILIARIAAGGADGCRMQLVRGAGGEGKSTALLQAAAQAARGGEWTVLYRPAADAHLNGDVVAQLDPDKKWLIVADDAADLIDDLWAAAGQRHRRGGRAMFFLLAARDTDWRLQGGDARGWSTRLDKMDDLTLGHIAEPDAGLVVDAWAGLGDDGLRALKGVKMRDQRVRRLMEAARARDVRGEEGSLFGGLLDIRFGAAGLLDHLLPLLESLRGRPIDGGTATLFDALLYVANCHAIGMPGLDKRVLAMLCGVPVYRVSSAIITPLGKELGAAESRGHVLTRHRMVAEAVLVAADRLGTDLGPIWRKIVEETIALSKLERVGDTFSSIVHAGVRLKRDLPPGLSADIRGEIGIAAAEAAMAAMPQWSSTISARARALRLADYPQDGSDLLRGQFRNIKTTVDWKENLRGFFHEWATCEGKVGGRARRLSNAWLDAISLSDALPVDLAVDQAKLSCGGLAVAFEHLSDGTPSGVYARARRAVAELGLQANPDSRAATIFARHQQEVDAMGTAKPADNDQALAWLAEAAGAAWQELDDAFLRSLRQDGRLTFQKLRAALPAI